MIDAAACENLLRKTAEEGYELLKEMAASSYHPQSDRQMRSAGVNQVSDLSAVSAQLEALNRKLDSMNMGGFAMRVQEIFCEKCGGEHDVQDCQDGNPFYVPEGAPVKQVGIESRPRNDPYSNTFNPGWRNHPNLSWGGQNNQNRSQGGQQFGRQQGHRSEPREEKSSLEQMLTKFETRFQNQDAAIKGLENQIGQLAKMMSSRERGTLPSNTETNPKEQVMAIELRGGKILEENHEEKAKQNGEKSEKHPGKSSNSTLPPTAPSKIVIPPPFSAALKKAKLDEQFGKFLEIFKKLHIDIPFADALSQMLCYNKFLKEILSNKRKLEENEVVHLTENCSAVVQNKIPPKLKDPGSFSVSCTIGDLKFDNGLCDLGASINVMSFSVFRKLGIGELKPTRMSLQLADQSLKYPRGIVEDVLIRVNEFNFRADFAVLDMEECKKMPLILERPFLATGKALIDVHKGKLRLRVGK